MGIFNIDIIIVTRNRPVYLDTCVKHICSNTLKPKFLIIIDSSTLINHELKNTIKLATSRNGIALKYYNIPFKGVGFSRNFSLTKVKSPYFVFIDDDEYAPKQWLSHISGILKKNKKIRVLAGPKIPTDLSNYWHEVWYALSEKEHSYSGIVNTIPSGNSCYQTQLIRKYKLKFDDRFVECSEDQAFSDELRKNNITIYFSAKVWVGHDLRRSFVFFIKQWFFYGKNKFLYHKYCLGSGSLLEISKIQATMCNLFKSFSYRISLSRIQIYPGFILLNFMFLCGYIYSLGQSAKKSR